METKNAQLLFSNSWEDPQLLLEALGKGRGKRILSIAAAGDSSLSLLSGSPEEILAIDTNPFQLYLVELKKMAIKHLDRWEVLAFLGFAPCENRLSFYQELKGWLSYDAQVFWDAHKDLLANGIIFQGKFEKYFSFFAKRILPLIHSKNKVAAMFQNRNADQQLHFYMEHWNTLRWRIMFKLFFNSKVLKRFKWNLNHLPQLELPVEDYLFQQAESQLSAAFAAKNPLLRFALKGSFDNELPHYLKEEHFPLIKQNIDRLKLQEGDILSVLKGESSFEQFNLGLVPEQIPHKKLVHLAAGLAYYSSKEANIAYWNLSQPQRLSQIAPGYFQFRKSLSELLSQKDQGFFCQYFTSEVRI
ncbi:MAG: DUF3419 family protein [Bacteroidia bacterium]|nr:DUF3419 family protein [Bacteroidia bacterium]